MVAPKAHGAVAAAAASLVAAASQQLMAASLGRLKEAATTARGATARRLAQRAAAGPSSQPRGARLMLAAAAVAWACVGLLMTRARRSPATHCGARAAATTTTTVERRAATPKRPHSHLYTFCFCLMCTLVFLPLFYRSCCTVRALTHWAATLASVCLSPQRVV